jgi:acetyl-CoA C-acetyltransferase
MSTEPLYIIDGARTPIGSFLGSLSSVSAPDLGATAIKAALERSKIAPEHVQEVYMGCVLTAGIGQAPARQALIKAGIPTSTGATTVSKVCGSGMKAVMLGRNDILVGDAEIVVAGGMESMSQTPYLAKGIREGAKMGHQQLIDAMIYDGLWDPYGDMHMGNCAERCVEKYTFTREDQDNYATTSYKRALESIANGSFKEEIAPVEVPQRRGDALVIAEDEEPKKANLDKLAQLKPAFEKTGTITAGNASSINDGATALVLASEKAVKSQGLKPMARIVATATHSQDPLWFTTAPIGAVQKALAKANLTVDQIDLFEINEAFAAVALAAIKDLNLDVNKVNVRGGAISLGHPIGASGARILITLMYALKQMNKRYGLASLCIGGGEATAVIIENLAV